MTSLFEQQNKNNIEATERIFRTAYECAKSKLSFSEHTRLTVLQKLNGADCGNILYSDHSCRNIVDHIASEMRKELVDYILKTNAKFSIMIDESTSCDNAQSMIVYVRLLFLDEPCVYFLGLIPLKQTRADDIVNCLLEYLSSLGITSDVMSRQLLGFCSDGASTMVGEINGVATQLRSKFPHLKTFHCMAHRLELAVKNAVDSVNHVSYFRDFLDGLYKHFSLSPKNQREVKIVPADIEQEFLKIRKIFDVRWVFSSFTAVRALWRSYSFLYIHLQACSNDSERSSSEKAKCKGLAAKLKLAVWS